MTTFNQAKFHEGMFAAAWADYNDSVIPDEAPHVQRVSTQQAFIAGALAFALCQRAASAADDESAVFANLSALERSLDTMADQFFAEHEGENAVMEDAADVSVQHFDAPHLKREDMEALTGVINAFIAERTAARQSESTAE
jgi:pyruvoyl-dependent arginine decarboxylase (PvlArgDC)